MNGWEIGGLVIVLLVLAIIVSARWGPLAPNPGRHVAMGPPDQYQRWDSEGWLPATPQAPPDRDRAFWCPRVSSGRDVWVLARPVVRIPCTGETWREAA